MSEPDVQPVTPGRWDDLAALFERPGPRTGRTVTKGCWCMFWRQSGPENKAGWGDGNRAALEALVRSGREPGLLAYLDGEPVGWVSLGPREDFRRLEAARVLARVDDEEVWSVVCFYVHGSFKKQGVASALLEGAVAHATRRGTRILEGYASKPGDDDPFTGLASMFAAAGFTGVRDTGRRTIVRRHLRASSSREKLERVYMSRTNRAEVAMVECGKLPLSEPLDDRNYGGVDEPEPQVGIPKEQFTHARVVGTDEVDDRDRAVLEIGEELRERA